MKKEIEIPNGEYCGECNFLLVIVPPHINCGVYFGTPLEKTYEENQVIKCDSCLEETKKAEEEAKKQEERIKEIKWSIVVENIPKGEFCEGCPQLKKFRSDYTEYSNRNPQDFMCNHFESYVFFDYHYKKVKKYYKCLRLTDGKVY